jgi:hypothetical protein
MPTEPSVETPSGWTVVDVDEDFEDDGYEPPAEEEADDGAR